MAGAWRRTRSGAGPDPGTRRADGRRRAATATRRTWSGRGPRCSTRRPGRGGWARGAARGAGRPARLLALLARRVGRAWGRARRWSRSARWGAASSRRTPTSTSCWCTTGAAAREDIERICRVADALWYPLWDAGIGLDHSVRTVGEAIEVATTDLRAALGLLEARHLAGDPDLAERLAATARQAWRAGIRSRFDDLAATTGDALGALGRGRAPRRARPEERARRAARHPAARRARRGAARRPARPSTSRTPARLLLDLRTELHRRAGRARDVLRAQDADEVGRPSRPISASPTASSSPAPCPARRAPSSFATEVALRSARSALPRRGLAALRRAAGAPAARRRRGRARGRGGPGPRRAGLARPRPGAAPGRDRRPHRAADRRGHAAPPRRRRPGAARAVAARGAAASCCPCWAPARAWSTSSRRSTAPACGAGCSPSGARCATCPRATARTSGPSTATSSRSPAAPRELTTQRVAARTCCCSARWCTTSARAATGTTPMVGERLARHIGRRLGLWPAGRRDARRDGAPPPAAAAHRDAARPGGPGDRRARRRDPRRRPGACSSCWTPSPRPTRSAPARGSGRRGGRR